MKKFSYILMLLLSLTFGTVFAEELTFKAGDKVEELLNNTKNAQVTQLPGGGEKFFLILEGEGADYKLKSSFKVEGNKKYRLDLTIQLLDGITRESNSRVPEMQTQSSKILSGWQMFFYDAAGKEISRRDYRGMSFDSRDKNIYSDIFYTPANAASMQISFYLGKKQQQLRIEKIALNVAPDEGALNCNPEFKYGYSGWNSFLRGSLLLKDDNGVVFDSAYGSGGEIFPLAGSGKYKLFGRGETFGGYRVINFEQRDKDNKVIKTISIAATPGGNSTEFELEQNAVYGRLNVYNHLLREVRVTKVK